MSDAFFGIYWREFDWPSFATLVAGTSAALAAGFIGWRQVGITERQADIAERQTEILERQVALAELTLRNELFDKRHKAYTHIMAFIREVGSDGAFPTGDIRENFLTSLFEAPFLFSEEICRFIEHIWNKAADLLKAQVAINDGRKSGQVTDEESQAFIELLTYFMDLRTKAIPVFAKEMGLVVNRQGR